MFACCLFIGRAQELHHELQLYVATQQGSGDVCARSLQFDTGPICHVCADELSWNKHRNLPRAQAFHNGHSAAESMCEFVMEDGLDMCMYMSLFVFGFVCIAR